MSQTATMEDIKLENIVNALNCGVFVVDENYDIKFWNNFMASHSGKPADELLNKNLFTEFPDLPEAWLKKKFKSVFVLKNFAFTTWEQRPYLFKFYHNRPATSIVDSMRQNCTFIPVKNTSGDVKYVCVTLQDVTDTSIFQLLLAESKEAIEVQSRLDGLTGISNRRYWEDCFREEFTRVKRYGNPLCCVMLDIDHFKRVNDGLGHLAGDEVIKAVAKLVVDCLRESDKAGRYGGEEFGIFLPETPRAGAEVTAERIRAKVESSMIPYNDTEIQVTISLGISTCDKDIKNIDELIDRADQALYESKKGGRNRVTFYQS